MQVDGLGAFAPWEGDPKTPWTELALGEADTALCRFAVQLTQEPAGMRETHIQSLRAAGFDDVSIHDTIQVVAYFNYINRIADAIHVDLETDMPPYPEG